jgi:2-phosphosulfolactate phosphatase
MRVEVLLGATSVTPADVAGRVVAVVDVLRASTTIAVALHHGARAVIPFESAEEVVSRSKSFERADVRLAGERRMLPVPGFDFGNSPREFTRGAVEGKTILLSTTNGTVALVAVQGARDVVVTSYVNYTASLAFLRAAARAKVDVAIVAAGRERHFALEDAAFAGRLARGISSRMPHAELNDAAQACVLLDRRYGDRVEELFAASTHGRALAEAGFAADLALCAQIDAFPVVPVYLDRQISKLGPDWER